MKIKITAKEENANDTLLKILKEKNWGVVKVTMIDNDPLTITMTMTKIPSRLIVMMKSNDNFNNFVICEVIKIIEKYGGNPKSYNYEVV